MLLDCCGNAMMQSVHVLRHHHTTEICLWLNHNCGHVRRDRCWARGRCLSEEEEEELTDTGSRGMT